MDGIAPFSSSQRLRAQAVLVLGNIGGSWLGSVVLKGSTAVSDGYQPKANAGSA